MIFRFISDHDDRFITRRSYSSAVKTPEEPETEDFAAVIERLDTPEKAAEYTSSRFTFTYHDGCISYTPEEFFSLGTGDCKDFATFLSYVLDEHGYDAKIVAFKYYLDGKRYGHVVTLFSDTDGTLKYATTPDIRVFHNVTSVDDLLSKECARLGAPEIANYIVQPAGSLDCCVE